jgi:ABC-type dipeptide/oligopeptide/nickel transport system permease component
MLNILPSSGPLLDTTGSVWNWFNSFFSQWNYLVLPLLVFSASSVFYIAQLTCEVLWAEFEKPYALTLLSKGFERSFIIRNQLLGNAKIPVYVTMISVFPALVSGSLLLDYFFSLNGMGSIIVQAHASKDIPLITGAFLLSGVVSMLTFFLSDYLVSVIDPRGKKVQLYKSGE